MVAYFGALFYALRPLSGALMASSQQMPYNITALTGGVSYEVLAVAKKSGYTDSESNVMTVQTLSFVPVVTIIGLPFSAELNQWIALSGTAMPPTATEKTIQWSVVEAGGTMATVMNGNQFRAMAPGAVIMQAKIVGGGTDKSDYQQPFTITVTRSCTATCSRALSTLDLNIRTMGRG